MNIQAQLLTIIEDQQKKLDEVLKKLDEALIIIQKQSMTIEQYDKLNNELLANRTTLIDYQKKLTQALQNVQTTDLSQAVLSPLKKELDNHLKHLIVSLDIKSPVLKEIKLLIEMQSQTFKEQLNILQQNTQQHLQQQVKQAVEQEVKPIQQQLMKDLKSVQEYQQHLNEERKHVKALIQQLSAKL